MGPKISSFQEILSRRLEEMEPMDSFYAKNLFRGMKIWEIEDVKLVLPVLFLAIGKEESFRYDLWTRKVEESDERKVCEKIFENWKKVISQNDIDCGLVAESLIIQDWENRHFLIVSRILLSQGDFFYSREKLKEMKRRYGFFEIRWNSKEEKKITDQKSRIYPTLEKENIVQKICENLFLLRIAERFNMNEDQFLRFREKVENLKWEEKEINYERQANDVIHYEETAIA